MGMQLCKIHLKFVQTYGKRELFSKKNEQKNSAKSKQKTWKMQLVLKNLFELCKNT